MLKDQVIGFQADITTELSSISFLDSTTITQVSTNFTEGDKSFDNWSFWAMLPVCESHVHERRNELAHCQTWLIELVLLSLEFHYVYGSLHMFGLI